jgi:hypothetical protein
VRNYHLAVLAATRFGYRKARRALQHTATREVAAAFVGNMDRVLALITYPGKLLRASKEFGYVFGQATVEVTGMNHRQAFHKEYRKYIEMRPQILAACSPLPPEQMASFSKPGLAGAKAWEDWLFLSDATMMATGDYLTSGVESILTSMLVGTWTAFETLAGDLWEAVVNAHPHGLAQLAGKSKRDGQDKRDQGKMVQFALLELYNFDLRNVMGTMQRNMEKVGFTTLDKIRGAYADAFGIESPGICKVLDDPALDNLSIVRNVIVHKAGVCDKEYKDKSDGKTLIPQLGVGDPLPLDGQLVADLLSPTVACCVRLVQSADNWLHHCLSAPGDGPGA